MSYSHNTNEFIEIHSLFNRYRSFLRQSERHTLTDRIKSERLEEKAKEIALQIRSRGGEEMKKYYITLKEKSVDPLHIRRGSSNDFQRLYKEFHIMFLNNS